MLLAKSEQGALRPSVCRRVSAEQAGRFGEICLPSWVPADTSESRDRPQDIKHTESMDTGTASNRCLVMLSLRLSQRIAERGLRSQGREGTSRSADRQPDTDCTENMDTSKLRCQHSASLGRLVPLRMLLFLWLRNPAPRTAGSAQSIQLAAASCTTSRAQQAGAAGTQDSSSSLSLRIPDSIDVFRLNTASSEDLEAPLETLCHATGPVEEAEIGEEQAVHRPHLLWLSSCLDCCVVAYQHKTLTQTVSVQA